MYIIKIAFNFIEYDLVTVSIESSILLVLFSILLLPCHFIIMKKCMKCKKMFDRVYQDFMCKDCLLKRFNRARHLIDEAHAVARKNKVKEINNE